MTPEEKKKLKQLLIEEKNKIEGELNKFADKNELVEGDYKARFPGTSDSSDDAGTRALDIEEYEREKAIEQNLELRLKEINETLNKLEQGDDYGVCSNCKVVIDEKRLKAIPSATLCVACASTSFR